MPPNVDSGADICGKIEITENKMDEMQGEFVEQPVEILDVGPNRTLLPLNELNQYLSIIRKEFEASFGGDRIQ